MKLFLLFLIFALLPGSAAASEEEPLQYKEKLLGTYWINFIVKQPKFVITGNDFYNKLYDSHQPIYSMAVNYNFIDWYVTIGVGGGIGISKEKGYPSEPLDDNKVTPITSLSTELTKLTGSLYGTLQSTPFKNRWVVFTAWSGREYLSLEESRLSGDDSASQLYINRQTLTGPLIGASMSFRLDAWDASSNWSLRSMGLRSLYLTIFSEDVRYGYAGAEEAGTVFDHASTGIAFTFESSL